MKKIIVLLILSFSGSVFALPDCPSNPSAYFNNCYGTWSDGNGYKYVGEWVNDFQHGEGIANYANGDKFTGVFENGFRKSGTYEFVSRGDSYSGEYNSDGDMHGYGEYTFRDGEVRRGYYLDDEFIPHICADMGLVEGSESFGDCVVELIKKL